jgi:D-alanyl-D-alanine carboxypeptidase
VALVVVFACPAAPAVGSAASAERALETALDRLVRMPGGPPGVAAIVQREGNRRFHTAGVANEAIGNRWRPDDHMRLASVSKAFNGAAALSLVDRGRLSLSDRIRDWLPWLPESWGQVTVAQALHHTGGLPDYSQSKAFRNQFGTHPHAYVAPRALVEYVTGEPPEFAPGSNYEYSNTDNVVVGLVAAAASGRDYSGVLRRWVYRPLRLHDTTLPAGFRLPAPHVRGYVLSPPGPPEDATTLISMSSLWAAGGVQSTAADLNRFIRGYVGRRLFDRATQQQQLKFVKGHSEPPGPGVNSAGLGIFRYKTKCGVVYGHTGNLPGFTQFTASSLDGRRSVTVSANAQVAPNAESGAVRVAFKALRRADLLAVCAALAGR